MWETIEDDNEVTVNSRWFRDDRFDWIRWASLMPVEWMALFCFVINDCSPVEWWMADANAEGIFRWPVAGMRFQYSWFVCLIPSWNRHQMVLTSTLNASISLNERVQCLYPLISWWASIAHPKNKPPFQPTGSHKSRNTSQISQIYKHQQKPQSFQSLQKINTKCQKKYFSSISIENHPKTIDIISQNANGWIFVILRQFNKLNTEIKYSNIGKVVVVVASSSSSSLPPKEY